MKQSKQPKKKSQKKEPQEGKLTGFLAATAALLTAIVELVEFFMK